MAIQQFPTVTEKIYEEVIDSMIVHKSLTDIGHWGSEIFSRHALSEKPNFWRSYMAAIVSRLPFDHEKLCFWDFLGSFYQMCATACDERREVMPQISEDLYLDVSQRLKTEPGFLKHAHLVLQVENSQLARLAQFFNEVPLSPGRDAYMISSLELHYLLRESFRESLAKK